jgi:hypothetical protein
MGAMDRCLRSFTSGRLHHTRTQLPLARLETRKAGRIGNIHSDVRPCCHVAPAHKAAIDVRWILAGLVLLGLILAAVLLRQPVSTPPEEAQSLRDACTVLDEVDEACISDGLEEILRRRGQVAAFEALAELMEDPELQARDHALAHHLGRAAFEVSGNAAGAIALCPPGMGSGCMHGVIEGYFGRNGQAAPVRTLCSIVGEPESNKAHQCWHGVGHGLLMAHSYKWEDALPSCAQAVDFDGRVACSGGVFMELLMGDPASTHGGINMTAPPAFNERYHAEDLAYPCNRVFAIEASIGCWQNQPWVVVRFTNGSYNSAFEVCEQAGDYALACERGIGQMAATHANCMVGVVMEVMTHVGSVEPGLLLCSTVAQDMEARCYTAVGTYHRSIESRVDIRVARCTDVPEPHRDACAGVSSQ